MQPTCLPCYRWQRYSAALDEAESLADPSLNELRAGPCPEHDGWTLDSVAADLFAREGRAHPLSVGAVLNNKH